MRPVASLLLPLMAVGFAAGMLPAQTADGDATRVQPPAFQALRFEEDWSVLAQGRTGSFWDPVKFISLSADGRSYLSFGGHLRHRVESVRNFMLVGGDEREDVFGLTRAMAHADLHLTPHLRFFVEGRHSVAHGRDLPGGRRPADHDALDVHNGFVQVDLGHDASRFSARVGRQELLIGSQRLVSPVDWSNTRRTFDGVHARLGHGRYAVEAFWTHPVRVTDASFNRPDRDTRFSGVSLTSCGGSGVSGCLYLFRLENLEPVTAAGIEGTQDRLTFGGRLGAGALDGVRLEVEGGVQRGELADRDIRAWFVASDFGHTFARLPLRPTATLGLDWSSGDGGEAGVTGTFQPPFPLGHAYIGYTDVLGRQNLIEARGVVTAPVTPRLQLRAAGHHFSRASRSDGAYNTGGGLIEPGTTNPARHVGSELDLTGVFRLDRHLRVEFGYGRFAPGPFLVDRPLGARTVNWGFVSSTYVF